MRKVKIYTLSHPITNEIRCVGKTVETLSERLRKHLLKKEITHKYNWIISLRKESLIPIIELIEECDVCDWNWCEKYWISQFKCWGFNLTNLCEGGFGSNGMKHSINTKMKISAFHKGKKWRLGAIISDETRRKISVGNKNKKINRESVEKMIKTKTGLSCGVGRKHTNLHKNNIKKTMTQSKGKSILQFDVNMNFIREWGCINDASNELKIPNSNIVNVCKGNRLTAKNFVFKYK